MHLSSSIDLTPEKALKHPRITVYFLPSLFIITCQLDYRMKCLIKYRMTGIVVSDFRDNVTATIIAMTAIMQITEIIVRRRQCLFKYVLVPSGDAKRVSNHIIVGWTVGCHVFVVWSGGWKVG